jgi:hypothetical protein
VSEPLDAWTSVATHLYCPRCQTLPATGAVFAIHGESGAQVSLCEHCTTQREREDPETVWVRFGDAGIRRISPPQ